jgi:Flp pilus assembly pilin Flp
MLILRRFRARRPADRRHHGDDPMSDPRGQGLAEYALILALIAIVAIIALIFLGGQVSKILSDVGHSM